MTENESKKTSLETSDETRKLFREYYQLLGKLGIETIERGTRLQHTKWMCVFAEANINDEVKANRWLGWVQGWLVVENIFSLDETRAHSRDGKIIQDDRTRQHEPL